MKFKYSLIATALVFAMSCEPAEQVPADYFDNDGFKIELSANKALGHGQYELKAESGQNINVSVDASSTSSISSMKVTKTKNLEVDTSFGTNGEMNIPVSGNTLAYDFEYEALSSDVDQLVGFTFEAVNASGKTEVSDLKLVVTLSPRDNLPRRKWNLVSILHVNEGNLEVIKECEKDNAILFNADGTLQFLYGTDTGAGDCSFDGFNVYDKWTLDEEAQTFTIDYHGIFDPTPKSDVYILKSLTTEELKIQLEVDLSVFGLGVEKFLYIYQAGPK